MKNITITIKEFEALVAKEGWTHEVDVGDADVTAEMEDSRSDFPRGGWIVVTSKLGDITIDYTESYSYKLSDLDSFDVNTEHQSDVWTFRGVTIIDSDGYKMDEDALDAYFTDRSDSTQLCGKSAALTEFMPVEFMDFSSERDAREARAIIEIQAAIDAATEAQEAQEAQDELDAQAEQEELED